MVWVAAHDLLNEVTAEETDWWAEHGPNLSRAPRGWRPVAFIHVEDAEMREGEALRDAILRLKEYTPAAVAMALHCSESRVNQVFKEERERIAVIQAQR